MHLARELSIINLCFLKRSSIPSSEFRRGPLPICFPTFANPFLALRVPNPSMPTNQPGLPLRPVLSNASLRPILPKQTLLQNRTLATHVLTAMVSLLINCTRKPESCRDVVFAVGGAYALGDGVGGAGTMLGLIPSRKAVPATPTTVETMNPGFERSIRYHRAGLTMAKVNETCNVDCHGSLRCGPVSRCKRNRFGGLVKPIQDPKRARTIAKAIPTKAPMLRTAGVQSAPSTLSNLLFNLPLSSSLSSCGLASSGAGQDSTPSSFSPRVLSQKMSIHGSNLPSTTPATPQKTR